MRSARDSLLRLASSVCESAEALSVEDRVSRATAGADASITLGSGYGLTLSARVVRDGRIGLGTSFGPPDLPDLVDMAISAARIGPRATFDFPGSADPGRLDTSHPALEAMAAEDLAGYILQASDILEARQPGSVLTGSMCLRRSLIALANTSGFEGSYEKTTLEVVLDVSTPLRGCRTLTQGLRFSTGLPLADADVVLEDLLKRASLPVAEGWTPPSDCSVILAPQVLSTVLQSLRAGSSASALVSRSTPLMNREGARLAPSIVSIADRPRLPYGAASAPFDAEGVPTTDRNLISAGRFTGFVYDLATSAAAGSGSAGSAGRVAGDPPSPVCTNLVMSTGSESLEEMMRRAGTGMVVASVLPGGSGDLMKGDFDFQVSCAVVLSGGEPLAVASGFPFSGNAYSLLAVIESVEDSLHCAGQDWLPHILVSPGWSGRSG